jgi:hypothetical protein
MESEGWCLQQYAKQPSVSCGRRSRTKAVTQNIKLAIAALLLLGIAVVFFSPALDLQPTSGRHSRSAVLSVAALHAVVLSVWDTSVPSYSRFAALIHAVPLSTGCLVDLNCIRLC